MNRLCEKLTFTVSARLTMETNVLVDDRRNWSQWSAASSFCTVCEMSHDGHTVSENSVQLHLARAVF